jgi:hypothetical protein
MLPKSEIKAGLQNLMEDGFAFKENIKNYLRKILSKDIDVIIMTKLDKDNFIKEEQLPIILPTHMPRCGFEQYIRIFSSFICWDESKIIQLF